MRKRLSEQGIDFELTEEAKEKISDEGFDPEYGARPLRRALQRHVEDRLSEELLRGSIQKGDTAIIDTENGEFVVRAKSGANA